MSSVTSYSGNGLRDWLLQRVSAVILALYIVVLVGYFVLHSDMTYMIWLGLFEVLWFRLFTLLALISLLLHSWIGIWTIITDYIKVLWIRLFTQAIVAFMLIAYLFWGIEIIWRL